MTLPLFLATLAAASFIGYAALALPRLGRPWPLAIAVLGIAGPFWFWNSAPEPDTSSALANSITGGLASISQLGATLAGLVIGWKAADFAH